MQVLGRIFADNQDDLMPRLRDGKRADRGTGRCDIVEKGYKADAESCTDGQELPA